ncbi:hypothetical protein M9458_050335, partial [Cirrhinus mrigala]
HQESTGLKSFSSLLAVASDLGQLSSVRLLWKGELVWSNWMRRVRNIMSWNGSDRDVELSVWRIRIKSGESQENMPKIQPQTKVLIIKILKTKSPAELADIFNVSKRQVERMRKRFEETGEVHDRPSPGPALFQQQQSYITTGHQKPPYLQEHGLNGRISAQKPALNRRQLKTTLNRRQLKNHVAFAKAHSLQEGWTVEKWQKVDFSDEFELHPSRRKYCRRPIGTRMDPRFTQKTVKFGGGKIMVWGYVQVDGNINSLRNQDILAARYIPIHRRGQ